MTNKRLEYVRVLIQTNGAAVRAQNYALPKTEKEISKAFTRLRAWDRNGRKPIHESYLLEDLAGARESLQSEVEERTAPLRHATYRCKRGEITRDEQSVMFGDEDGFEADMKEKIREPVAITLPFSWKFEAQVVPKAMWDNAERLKSVVKASMLWIVASAAVLAVGASTGVITLPFLGLAGVVGTVAIGYFYKAKRNLLDLGRLDIAIPVEDAIKAIEETKSNIEWVLNRVEEFVRAGTQTTPNMESEST